jgi:hypothetical protein
VLQKTCSWHLQYEIRQVKLALLKATVWTVAGAEETLEVQTEVVNSVVQLEAATIAESFLI